MDRKIKNSLYIIVDKSNKREIYNEIFNAKILKKNNSVLWSKTCKNTFNNRSKRYEFSVEFDKIKKECSILVNFLLSIVV